MSGTRRFGKLPEYVRRGECGSDAFDAKIAAGELDACVNAAFPRKQNGANECRWGHRRFLSATPG